MSFPISIEELIDWSNGAEEKNSELASWLNLLGFKERKGLAKFLSTPLVRDKSMARQILRSWSGRKLLDEVSDLILMDEDSSGESVMDTLENLLDEKDEVTTFDLLNSLSVKAIHIDLDGWIEVANNWRSELNKQQKLINDLISFDDLSVKREEINVLPLEIKESKYELISLTVSHRKEPLILAVWNPTHRMKNRYHCQALKKGEQRYNHGKDRENLVFAQLIEIR